MGKQKTDLAAVISNHRTEILTDWLRELSILISDNRISEAELKQQADEFLQLLLSGVQHGNVGDISTPEWAPLRELLENFSKSRAVQGFTSSETATFIFSVKQPLFTRISKENAANAQAIADEIWATTVLLDKLGLHTVQSFQKRREEVISRQQEELLELSTPVVKLWEGVLALPMIGTLDSARTQVVMESLLQRIVETGSEIAIIDITGVPTVDTLVAQHLLKTVTAIRLMGADAIISGIRPQIAQTIVHLGVDLQGVMTKSTLADALSLALKRMGMAVSKHKTVQTQGG